MRRWRPSAASLGDVGLAGALVVVWTLAWGELSLANVAAGLALAVVLLAVFPISHDIEHVDHRVRPVAMVRLFGSIVWLLLVSNVQMVRDVLGGPSRERTGVVACPLRVDAPGLLTFLANVLALTPGTLPIEVRRGPPVIFLHVLRLEDPEAVRRQVTRLEELAVAALGSPAALEACRLAPPPWPLVEEAR